MGIVVTILLVFGIIGQVCEKDNLVSAQSYKNAAKILGEYAEVQVYPIDHFDIYKGESFVKAVNAQIDFFKRHFRLRSD